jgi:hypothetical protein
MDVLRTHEWRVSLSRRDRVPERSANFTSVIPGRRAARDPESRHKFGRCFWIPG